MYPMRVRSMLLAMLCGYCASPAAQSLPPGYPNKSIRLLVGNAPGGGIDITARVVAQKISEKWGRNFVVDNRPGASGLIALDMTQQAAPDGYTFLVTSGSLIASAMAQKKVPYDVRTAYAPVSQLTSLYYLLLINPTLPVNSVKELIAYGKSKPGALNYGSSGVGGAGHLGGELLASMAGMKMVHVPYKGGGLVLADLISGQIQLGFTSTISGMPHVRSGRLKGLAMTSTKRAAAFSDLPTLAEAGVPGFALINWYGLFGPANTPPAIVALLHRDVSQSLATNEAQTAFAKDGADAAPSASPDAFRRVLAKEVEDWQKIVKLPGFAEALR